MKARLLIILFFCQAAAFAQINERQSFAVKSRLVTLDVVETSIFISGYDGDSLIIEPDTIRRKEKVYDISDALRGLLSAKDERLLNVEVVNDNKATISIKIQPTKNRFVKITVPINADLKCNFLINSPQGIVSLHDLMGKLELSGTVMNLNIDRIKGPLALSPGQDGKGVAKKVLIKNVLWDSYGIKGNGINVMTGTADVDISMPETLKTSVLVVNMYGDLYSDLNIKDVSTANGKFIGQVNGGGAASAISVITSYGNVFLRKE